MLLVRTELRPSAIDGIGCFAAEHIAKGTPVWRFVPGFDQLIHPSFAAAMCDPEYLDRYAQRCPYTGYWVLCVDNARLMNHSDEPNVSVTAPLGDPLTTHDAVRDIEAGEEMTCDYTIGDINPFSGWEMHDERLAGAAG